ncbi:hypothetical protein [Aquibaculum arenosum]|uniref:Uncharacterized protein n=1 Tax=Aquibaculum arenosum TaxID=3032591 RepID=A0ABT5YJL9_9PROT|nr:hypothetical protein [Fodinicurvata sp. CAU 1616]MDF2095130.1 hypothetical protein [Fodinicurvata sp. CAU 1616]
MFGLPSLTKLLVLAGIILAVWYGFRFVGKLDAARKVQAKQQGRGPKANKGRAPRAAVPDAEEMVACPACRAYVPATNPSNCGRPDCPY